MRERREGRLGGAGVGGGAGDHLWLPAKVKRKISKNVLLFVVDAVLVVVVILVIYGHLPKYLVVCSSPGPFFP